MVFQTRRLEHVQQNNSIKNASDLLLVHKLSSHYVWCAAVHGSVYWTAELVSKKSELRNSGYRWCQIGYWICRHPKSYQTYSELIKILTYRGKSINMTCPWTQKQMVILWLVFPLTLQFLCTFCSFQKMKPLHLQMDVTGRIISGYIDG